MILMHVSFEILFFRTMNDFAWESARLRTSFLFLLLLSSLVRPRCCSWVTLTLILGLAIASFTS